MRNYSIEKVFSERERDLLAKATTLVAYIPDFPRVQYLRCHEVARAVGQILKLPVQDGHYGMVEHSWLWTAPVPKSVIEPLPAILDVYAVGALPQVQLIDPGSTLPHMGYAYQPGAVRKDINHKLVERIVAAIEKTCPTAWRGSGRPGQ